MKTWRTIGLAWGGSFAALAVVGAGQWTSRYNFAVNETNSLPNWAYVTDLANRAPRRGDLVNFVAPDNRYYPRGARFVKHAWGVPGDVVTRVDRTYFVNGRNVGVAKPFSQTGAATAPGPVGIIPPHHYYVGTPSKDSLDSRYRDIGWIDAGRIVGVARPIL